MSHWLVEMFPDNSDSDLIILASHWLVKFQGAETGEGYLPPTATQLPNGQRIWPGGPWTLAKEVGMGWSPQQTQEAIRAVMATGLFRAAVQPESVTLDEEVLLGLRVRHRRKLRKDRKRMQALKQRPERHRGFEQSITLLAKEMGWTQETTELAVAELMEMGLAQEGSRPGTVNVEALVKFVRQHWRG